MGYEKAIRHGKTRRRAFRGSKRFDSRCRNNGACGYCRGNRTHSTTLRERSLTFTVHAANKDRLQAALDRRQRVTKWTWPHDDISEEWIYLDIAPKVSDGG